MFEVNETGDVIKMHAGDTGAFKIAAKRASGEDWTEDDRMLFTISDPNTGDVLLQRFYRLDDDEGLGNGVIEIQFHNNDTDTWAPGTYSMERRYNVAPRWNGNAPTGRVVNALTAGVRMVEGDVVRTVVQGSLTVTGIMGDI